MQLSNELKPALAVISGGLGDIGKAIARALSQAGAEVALADVLPHNEAQPDGPFYRQVDVSDFNAVDRWFEQVTSKFGRAPNLIIPNAAIVTFKQHLEITPAEWKRELDVNLNGAFYFADSGTRRLVEADQPGRVVFIGSWAGHAPHRWLPAYSVAKAGLRMLTQTLALELASRGILVNEVAPGYVNAGLSGKVFAADPELRGAPTGHTLPIREVRLSAGAGFVVAMAGEIMSMPGLPRVPAAEGIRLTADGEVDGIF